MPKETKEKMFLISPVRKADKKSTAIMERYVSMLEHAGYEVHWPLRDTIQDKDTIGLKICYQNDSAMADAKHIKIYWIKDSRGSCADLGTTLALALKQGKKVSLVNRNQVIKMYRAENKKSLEGVLLALDMHTRLFDNRKLSPQTIISTYKALKKNYGI